jgi:hypothetical protein
MELARMAARLPCLGLTHVQTGSIPRVVDEHRFHQRNKWRPALSKTPCARNSILQPYTYEQAATKYPEKERVYPCERNHKVHP